jgi:uncharacterized membrane-anchored protein YhcB (DUF1043 family)
MVNVDDLVQWLRAYTTALSDMRLYDDTPDEYVNEVVDHIARAADTIEQLDDELTELKGWRTAAVQRITGI